MYQEPLPQEYVNLPQDEIDARITAIKEKLGNRLVILGHHYQRDEIIRHADFRGDSYKLAKNAAATPEAEFIVFCGVHFMAESADILTPDNQKVILPNLAAGCSMADMANLFQVRSAWKQIHEIIGDTQRVVPVTYINSAANLKAFVGEHDGTVCTSTNAPTAVAWALEQGDKVFFFPDQHLGRNTGVKLGYDPETQMILWDPFKPLGGNTEESIRTAKFILWKGHCSVHKRFSVEQIEKARREHPGVKVLVHPECELDVVKAADLNGSTEFILKTVTESAPGSIWAVGTEINLVSRIAKEQPDKTIFCLDPEICPCSTMYRIHPSFLLWSLDHIANGDVVNQIVVPEKIRENALVSLQRMLTVCA
ncbi:MAG: quinolinate synthase NadA [Armatimonadetes bacterium]|nr:quinolinate synthase NadA [Armatimonadota bacterium]